ncbi:BMA-GON-1, isoform e [Aphelenchoides fujianensis]|nr:BMA-GON-1, isoform e [Aphelenchoides fujianensis]
MKGRLIRSDRLDVKSDDGQIWLINLHEIRRRRHLNPQSTDRAATRNGQRLRGPRQGVRPTVDTNAHDTWNSENQTHVQQNRISADCLYEAHVVGTSERGTVNLCDPNGGLFGTLALADGAFIIEPLIEAADDLNNANGGTERTRRSKRSLQLKPHLIYRARSQTFDPPLPFLFAPARLLRLVQQQQRVRRPAGRRRTRRMIFHLLISALINSFLLLLMRLGRLAKMAGRRRRSANSWDHFVEVLVVADYKMLAYHQSNLENYILTLFSTVASIYRHASLGASVNIIVVRIIILKYDNGNPRISNRAQDTLQQFCAWQQAYNDRNDDAVAHHDVAILLTRHDICRATNKCDTLGLAELGTMCDSKKSCAIIEDNGLSAAFTIAHELGHIFNIPHDDERRCAQHMPLNKNSYHIMAPTLEYNTNPKFLDSHRSQTQCIMDKPVEQRYFDKMFNFPLAGELYDVNRQCQFVFGATAEICPYMPTCRRLWCSTVYGFQMGCRTQHMPWADGTPCGKNQWCHQGACIGLSPKHLKKVDGAWGEWQPFGACSRTCGGGVQKGVRDCDSPRPTNGGKYCIGQRERYKSCNVHECPFDTPGFREVQCAEFNDKDVGIHGIPRSTKWIPKYTSIGENERCRTTRCTTERPARGNVDDICIDGTCHRAGCDHRLASDMKRDSCGVCGGDGSTCETVQGVYNERGSFGYNEVLKIPAGSANIDISQKSYNNDKDDDNYLALRTSTGEFLLNGQYQVSVFRQQIPILDTVLEYSGSDHTVERINGSGPIHSDIYVHVLSVGNLNPPGRSLQVHGAPSADPSAQRPPSPSLVPAASQLLLDLRGGVVARCSAKCQGTQVQQVVCMDALSTKPVNEQYCVNKRPETKKRMCNVEITPTSGCSARCGAGEQQQQSACVRSFTSSNPAASARPDEPAGDQECEAAGQRRPPDRVYCLWTATGESGRTPSGLRVRPLAAPFCVDGANRRLDDRYCERTPREPVEQECNRIPCPKWAYGEWTECSRSCDGGVRRRHAVCQNAAGGELAAASCVAGERVDHERCNEFQCTQWKFGPWSSCSATCGVGVETRDARCVVAASGVELADDRCEAREKILRKACQRRACPEWKVGSWSACSATCGDGFRQRSVQCVEEGGGSAEAFRSVAAERCSGARPSSHETCSGPSCPFWRVGQWSRCSVSCGQGRRERTVECVQPDGQLVDSSLCTGVGGAAIQQPPPPTSEVCRLIACAQWKPAAWDSCSKSCGDGGVQRRELKCTRGETEVVPDSECQSLHRPKTERACDAPPCDAQTQRPHVQMYPRQQRPEVYWATGAWSPCSKSCDGGTQRRIVQCHGHQRVLPDAYCRNVEVEASERECNTHPCTHWTSGEWTACSGSCGVRATQRRLVTCVANNPAAAGAANVSSADCDPTDQPAASRSCNLPACPKEARMRYGEWRTGEWSTCSMICGVGYRRRSIFCTEAICRDSQKPAQYEHCNLGECRLKTSWQVGPWTHCSVSCGSDGYQMRKVWCQADSNPLQQLNESECERADRPAARRGCAATPSTPALPTTTQRNPFERKYSWSTTDWSTCSTTCGAGLRTREVHCVDSLTKQNRMDPSLCDVREKPSSEHRCRQRHCPRWYKEPWSTCSATCGQGVRKREVYCKRGRKDRVPDHMCPLIRRPEDLKPCELRRCPTYRWRVGPWTRCTDACKAGEQTRRVYCMSDDRKRAAPRMCANDSEPLAKRPCPLSECPYYWAPGPWSTCSQTCGRGFHFRRIECKIKAKRQQTKTPDGKRTSVKAPEPTVASRMCISLDKPTVSEVCVMNPCNSTFTWAVGQWSACSASCGAGMRKRRVKCVRSGGGERAERSKCDQKYRPARREPCSMRNCLPSDCAELKAQTPLATSIDGNYTVLVAGYRVQVFCHRMNETLPKTYLNVRSESNFAEFYGKRLVYPHSCPHNGQRNDSCECTDDGHASAGRTEFAKLRVDLHNMKINPHDFTFARTLHGTPVALGTAGDCYAMADCPQGRFSIDLRSTGLRLVDDLQWKEQGHRTSARIERKFSNTLVQGQCGGYCGECAPDKFKGLVLEIDHQQRPAVGAG